ncbi:YhgE/Pip domain-containing protein [Cellulomonas fimi]|uniref:YhgE/Pip N-terminal domain protein n=3 Tax=Cellulomonas fimi TaxID=1708 RepID=F4H2A3_CELFA|nr:YhgE/Pip domain-containing protein [Cellulomonas fimi]AEE46400.1 YhgE/Pip N-terminal domain protein [Cellulomonas fimi ATCC 484]VEH32843.1 YhgE/Pip C-terminal domain [Cellulomonas fimi]
MLSLTAGTELRRFRRGTLPRLAVVAMIVVPLLYGVLYLWAFWNPTGHLDRIPVALVDADAGAVRDGTPVDAGGDLVERLVDEKRLDWVVTDAADAAAGVDEGRYYFAVTIPADFSADLVSAGGDAPRSARIDVTYDDANSFLVTSLGRTAMERIRAAVSATAGEQAVDAVLVGLTQAHDGLAQASDGAVQLRGATHELATGATTLADGAHALRDGAGRAADGAADLEDGTAQVRDGAATTADAAGRLADGSAQVADGVHAAVAQVDALAASAEQVPAQLGSLTAYLTARAQGGDAQAAQILSGLAATASSLPDAATLDAATQSLHELDAGARGVADGSAALRDGAAQLAAGAADVRDGAAALADGTADVAAGATDLSDGADRLTDGTGGIEEGASTLADALTQGTAAVPSDPDGTREARAAAIAEPVALEATDRAAAEGFGEGIAPFFLPLALFLGGVVTWMLLRPVPPRALATPARGARAALAGFAPAFVMGVAQVVALLTVLRVGLGLTPSHPLGALAFTVLVVAAFLALQQMLLALLGTAAGRVATLALLVLQLASAGGTYPVETSPAFFRALHPLLPMSYGVDGLRALLTGNPDGRLWTAVAYLVTLLVGSLAVTSWRAGRMRTWTLSRLHPALTL